jgi:hypothetical protein
MMGLGVVFMVGATWHYRQQMKALGRIYPEVPFSLSLALAGCVALLGVVGFAAGIFRL